MEANLPMFTPQPPANLGKLLISCHAFRQYQGELALTLHQKGLVQASAKRKQAMIFDFDLKYGFTASPIAIFFQKNNERAQYNLFNVEDLNACRQILKQRINQRGFHELFKPKKKIGKGNFASVYLAQKLENGHEYAVKAFSKESAYSEDKGKECLIKEIEIMRSLNHKCCMKLHEVFESQNSLYIVVELLDGGQLYDKIRAKYKFKPLQIKLIIHSILQGLKEMHSKRIMHRDLKPENLIFRTHNSWECVIADFGLAEYADSEEYLFVRCGTPGYVAPEVINIRDMKVKYEPICDIFSLGLIFHILLFGVSAFPGKTYNQVLAQNRASNITFDDQYHKSIDSEALNLLKKMLKKSPTERISAKQALNHPYLVSLEELEEEITDEVEQLVSSNLSYPNCDSPLLTSNNPVRMLDKTLKKDSCVDFRIGKDNVFTGKVETIAQTASTHNSVGKHFQSVNVPKVSKFCVRK